MSLTVIHKSRPSPTGRKSRIALVLAGGAVTGGAFKLGGLKALDDFLVDRKTTQFDVYVGLSAGAFLAVPLAAGISPDEMIRSLDGRSERFSPLRPEDVYRLNAGELAQKPLRYLFDLGTFVPRAAADATAALAASAATTPLSEIPAALRSPAGLLRHFRETARAALAGRRFPMWFDYLPSGLFDNSAIERYLRLNLERAGVPNDFRALHRRTGRELYVVAMNLDTAERVVFGHDADVSATLSEAVQASTALPGFYKPVRLDGGYYVDGGVQGTANIDVAVERGAELVICYNPFRPVYNRDGLRPRPSAAPPRESFALGGLLPVLNQVFRTLLHSRLHLGLRRYRDDPGFHGDIIVIEPTETDLSFFGVNPFAFWKRHWAAQHGHATVSAELDRHAERLRPVFERHGIGVRSPSAEPAERRTPVRAYLRPAVRLVAGSRRAPTPAARSAAAPPRPSGWWKVS